jgi:hypothetical protein
MALKLLSQSAILKGKNIFSLNKHSFFDDYNFFIKSSFSKTWNQIL